MKNIIIVILILGLSILGIYFSISHIDDKYQSAIAVAIATASIQLILFFLKQEFDSESTKKSKAFGVIYDKRFLAYHNLYDELFLAKLDLINFLKNSDNKILEEKSYNSIRKLNTTILLNRLLLSKKLYKNLNDLYSRFYKIYNNASELDKIIKDPPREEISLSIKQFEEDWKYLNSNIPFNAEILEIENFMKKELHIE